MSGPRLAVIGAGYMGSNHARVISESGSAALGVIVDSDLEQARRVARPFGAAAFSSLEAAMECDAAIVATSTDSHLDVALALIDAGIPILVEKPLAPSIDDVEKLVNAADAADVPLSCGFVERFNPVIETARSIIDEPVLHLVALRHSPHSPRATNSVVFDLLIHDIDLAALLVGSSDVVTNQAQAWTDPGSGLVEIADCTLRFASGAMATLSASRASQRKLRSYHLATATTLLELDLLRHDITVYRNLSQDEDQRLAYRAQTNIDIPFVRHDGEPLALQLDHFLNLVAGRADPAAERATLVVSHRLAAEVECPSGAKAR